MNYETIGKFIQQKRKEKNLTKKELAYIYKLAIQPLRPNINNSKYNNILRTKKSFLF